MGEPSGRMLTDPSPTGAQWLLSHGNHHAVVVEVGGGLRSYAVGGVDVVAGYRADQPCVHGRGQVLAPWPNRIRDGRYTVDGVEQQLSVTEVPRHNASHGLVRWALWELVRQEPGLVEVRYRLHPQPGWLWHLDLRQVYRLSDAGLTVAVSAENLSGTRAPFGYAPHPYAATAGASPERVSLEIPAQSYLQVDPDRLLPIELAAVAGTAYDFGVLRPVTEPELLDTAYTGLRREGERWRVRVVTPAQEIEVWGGAGLDWVQVFTEKVALPLDGPFPPGIAVEPMSCPPDAFNSGIDLVWIEPGGTWRAEWGIRRA